METITEKKSGPVETLHFEDSGIIKLLCGEHDQNLKKIGKKLGVKVRIKGNDITMEGRQSDIYQAKTLLQELYFVAESGYRLTPIDVIHALKMLGQNSDIGIKDVFLDTIVMTPRKNAITPKSFTQKAYVDAIRNYDIVFGIGPAGTGKTYLAMAMAITAFMKKQVDRIILTRPAVEAGEKLGFLPGDLFEKVNPYLRPLYDALHDIMDFDRASELLHQGIIEVAPIAFMRGRTLNGSFVILDEAQNTTAEQMKMFLTRIGFNSRAVITGDITQIDLPSGAVSGLVQAHRILEKIPGIKCVFFSEKDIVRHPLVEAIIKAYDAASQKKAGK